MGSPHYFVLRQGGGWIFVTSLHFTTKSAHVYIITAYNRILHANTPTQYKLNFCISHAFEASHKWTSSSDLTFLQEKDSKFHADEFLLANQVM